MKLIIHNIAIIARSFRILDETAYRNLCIKLEFEEIKNTHAGETVEMIMQNLSIKHNLGYNTIRNICYSEEEIPEIPSINPSLSLTKRRPYSSSRRRP